MASRFDGRNEYNILQKVQAALHAISHLTIMPINPLFIQFENRLEVQAGHR